MPQRQTTFILASGSPRRLELLQQLGVVPDQIIAPEIDETAYLKEAPKNYVKRLACQKAQAVKEEISNTHSNMNSLVFAADTIVAIGRKIMPKPKSRDEAAGFLWELSGRTHKVFTAICVLDGNGLLLSRVSESRVRFNSLSQPLITAYLDSKEWQGKAGGYAIQGKAGCFVNRIVGSYSTIVGLDLAASAQLLMAANYPFLDNWIDNPSC